MRYIRNCCPVILASFLVLAHIVAQPPKRTRVTILSTTDLHGNILPVDYYTNKPDNRGLAKVATIVRQVRQEDPNLILIDSGDTIQGTPLAYYHNKKNNAPPDPMMLTMSALGYDAMAVGNHEYNFGLDVLNKARREAKFPWLSANTYKTGTNETYFPPYVVKVANDVRVGILGLTTAGIPVWENKPNYAGLEFRAPLDEAKKWVYVLRTKEKADVVIIAMHMGLEEDLRTGEKSPGQVAHENEALAIARNVPGVDAIFMGHTHREIPTLFVEGSFVRGVVSSSARAPFFVYNNVLLTQANHWGRHLARADIYLDQDAKTKRWRVVAKQSRTIPMGDKVQPDAEIVALAKPYHEETQSYLSKVIGQSAAELTAGDARFRDNALLDLIQRVQLEAGQGDVSMVAPFNLQARVAAGPVTVRDMAGLYIYENTLVTLHVTGAQLKQALEHSARFFKPYEPGKTPAELVDEKIPPFNFDVAEGVEYELDITKPFGNRIQNLRFKGQPLNPAQKLRLVTNNYRVNGGGGYAMYKDAPVLYRSSDEIRQLIIEWLERNGTVPAQPTNNWRLLPQR
jgi:2',3'-cyclic-nucleotide 2'-phosphodiesterase/3'-nucleotidase